MATEEHLTESTRNPAARDARRLLRPLRDEVIALAQALVRVDSVAIPPDGHETGAQKLLAGALEGYGLEVELYDAGFLCSSRHPYARRGRNYRGRHNLVARLGGTGRGRSLLLSGHVDTVPRGPRAVGGEPVVRGAQAREAVRPRAAGT